MRNSLVMIVRYRLLGIAVCLAAAASAAAQAEKGLRLGSDGRHYGIAPATMSVPSPEALRDSLAFAANVKGFAPRMAELPRWRVADSLAVPTVDYRSLGRIAPASAMPHSGHNPYAFDFSSGGIVTQWRGGAVVGSSVGVVQRVGNLTLTGSLSADRYMLWRGTRTHFGIGGAATYRFSDEWSATVFGRYTDNRAFYTMAAFPYMGTSGYGGFVTFMGERVGVDFGVERYYDTFARRWVTSPIITPKIKFSEKFTLELPVGPLIKEVIDNAVFNRKERSGPIIMPEGLPSVGEIPFGTPEMPK